MNTPNTVPLQGSYIVVSDIQGNIENLQRFFAATKNMKRSGYICLGDIVDKSINFADNRCLELVKSNARYCVNGNHDDEINHIKNPTSKIFPENIEFATNLPKVLNLGSVLLFHSSVRQEGLRLRDTEALQKEAEYILEHYPDTKIALFGHSHQKGCHFSTQQGIKSLYTGTIRLEHPNAKIALINPGGIGLHYGEENTFARIDFDRSELHFFTLEKAEEMSYLSELVKAFDNRYMPNLTEQSYTWFRRYVKNDYESIVAVSKNKPVVRAYADRLKDFDYTTFEKSGSTKKRDYLELYSLELAAAANRLRYEIDKHYDVPSPLVSRLNYLTKQSR